MNLELNFNVLNILILSSSIHGFLFAFIVFFSKKYKSKANNYLAQVVLYISASNLYYCLWDIKFPKYIPNYRYIYIPWDLLVAPMFYYYITTYIGKEITLKHLKKPFFIFLSIHIFFLIQRIFFKDLISLKQFRFFSSMEGFFVIGFTVFLLLKIVIILYKFEQEKKLSEELKVDVKWFKRLLYSGIAITFLWGGFSFVRTFVFPYSVWSEQFRYYFVWLFTAFLTYWLGYSGVYQSQVFNRNQHRERLNILKTTIKFKEGKNEVRIASSDIKYIKSDGNYLEIHHSNGKTVIREKISNFLSLVPDPLEYIKVRRSYIVRLDKIEKRNKKELVVGGELIQIGKTYQEVVEKVLFE